MNTRVRELALGGHPSVASSLGTGGQSRDNGVTRELNLGRGESTDSVLARCRKSCCLLRDMTRYPSARFPMHIYHLFPGDLRLLIVTGVYQRTNRVATRHGCRLWSVITGAVRS